MKNIYLKILDQLSDNSTTALATVIETQGSTPQKYGSSALFDQSGLIAGTVGGGVLEGRVQQLSLNAIKTKKSAIYQFSFDKDISHKDEAICGGQATVLIDATPERGTVAFGQIRDSLAKRIPGILMTSISGTDESQKQIDRHWITAGKKNDLPEKYPDYLKDEAKKILSISDHDNLKRFDLKIGEEEILLLMEPVFPLSQLIIAGAGHIGRSLAHFGKLLDFDVTVIDDRIEYANTKNIPDADHIIVKDIGIAIEEMTKDSETFVVIVTRGHNDDAKALKPCINSGAAYIGMIGSKTKIAKMRRNFIENGWTTESQWSAIHAPVGLEILSQTVEEIAVSIAAEIVFVRNQRIRKTGPAVRAEK